MSEALASSDGQASADSVKAAVVECLEAAFGPIREACMSPAYNVDMLLGIKEVPATDATPNIPAEFSTPVDTGARIIAPEVRTWMEDQELLPGAPRRVRLPEPTDIADLPTVPMPSLNAQSTVANTLADGSDARDGAVAALVQGSAEVILEQQVQPDLFPPDTSYHAEPIVAADIKAWNELANIAAEESPLDIEPEDIPYSNGSNAKEMLRAAPEGVAKLRLAGKAAVRALFNHIRHSEPIAQVVQAEPASQPKPVKQAKPKQPTLLEIIPAEYKGLADIPEAFIADGMGTEELLECLKREDRLRLVFDRAGQASLAAFRDAMHSKHSITPNFSDPIEAQFLREGQAAYEHFQQVGGKDEFEHFMTGRRASIELDRARDATIAAYERGELTIELNAGVVRELRDLDIAVQVSEHYYESLVEQEDRNPDARARREAIRARVDIERNRLITRVLVA